MGEDKKNFPGLTPQENQAIEEFLLKKGLPLTFNITFADLRAPDEYSEIRSREEIMQELANYNFRSFVVPGISIAIPIVSANMESVSGVKLITRLQRLGGLGIPPQTLRAEDRLKMLEQIGQEDCAYRENPLTVRPYQTVREIRQLARQTGIQGFFVIDDEQRPVGVLSSRDWLYESDETKQVAELMCGGKEHRRPLITAPKGINFEQAAAILKEHRIEKLPLVDERGRLAGAIFANGLFYKMHYPLATRDERGQFLKVASIGVGRKFGLEQIHFIEKAVQLGVKILLIDTARAYAANAQEAIKGTKQHFPQLSIIAGNTTNPKGVKALIEWGADCVKVGQGPGEVCRTGELGVGIPQISACAKASAVAHLHGKTVMLDGGMKSAGDIGKALWAGADTVMLGSLLAGAVESAAFSYENEQGYRVKTYAGSASFSVQHERLLRGDLDRIRRPEGIQKEIPVRGTVREIVMDDILYGLASLFSYVGARSIQEFREKAHYELVSSAGFFEGSKRKN